MHFPRTLAITLLAGSLAMTGCSSSSSSSSSATAPDPLASSLGPGAAADVSKKTCTADAAGAWSLAATVKNSTDQKSLYTFTVSVVKTVGSTVVASKEVTKEVAAKVTAQVEAKKVVTTKGSKGYSCVVSVRAKRS